MAEKSEDQSRRKSTGGNESSVLRVDRESTKTKSRGSTRSGRHYDSETGSEPGRRHSGRTKQDEYSRTDSHISSSAYTEATVGRPVEYFSVASTDASSQPQPNAGSNLAPPVTVPVLQNAPVLPGKASPPSDAAKDGRERHSKRKSSRTKSSNVQKRASDAGISTSSVSQNAPPEKNRDDSLLPRHGSPGIHSSQTGGKEQLNASSAQASLPRRRGSLRPRKSKRAGHDGKEASQRTASVISDTTMNGAKQERQTEERTNELLKYDATVDHWEREQKEPVQGSSVTLPRIATGLHESGHVGELATESALALQVHDRGVLAKGGSAETDAAAFPTATRDDTQSAYSYKASIGIVCDLISFRGPCLKSRVL
ncbi:hypothetical protein MRX96_042741 [Rhipicephalus microplus]